MRLLVSIGKNNDGATSIEYALIASLISIAGIVAFVGLGDTLLDLYDSVADQYCTALGGSYANDKCTLP